MKQRYLPFARIHNYTTFTPANGEIGASKVYVKQPNGVCRQLGTQEYGIFWPDDKVVPVRVPTHVFKKGV